MPLRNLVWLLAVPAVVAVGLAVSYSAPAPDNDYKLVRQIVDVLAEVDQSYVRELDDADRQKLVEDMINGGLQQLDPHSEYLNAERLAEFERDSGGQYAGVGMIITTDPETKFLQIHHPMPGTPGLRRRAGGQRPDREDRRQIDRGVEHPGGPATRPGAGREYREPDHPPPGAGRLRRPGPAGERRDPPDHRRRPADGRPAPLGLVRGPEGQDRPGPRPGVSATTPRRNSGRPSRRSRRPAGGG